MVGEKIQNHMGHSEVEKYKGEGECKVQNSIMMVGRHKEYMKLNYVENVERDREYRNLYLVMLRVHEEHKTK